jgi:hypothetical protein
VSDERARETSAESLSFSPLPLGCPCSGPARAAIPGASPSHTPPARTLIDAVTFTRVPTSTPSFISLPGPKARVRTAPARPWRACADERAGARADGAPPRRLVQDCMG